MKLKCFKCGKPISSNVPNDTTFAAIAECIDCIEVSGDDLDIFQEKALTFAKDQADLNYCVLGLNGEAGEVADKFKKIIRDKQGVVTDLDKTDIGHELGDCLWYVAVTAKRLGFDLSDIAAMNVSKLTSRKKRNMIGGSGDNR